jgi:hypothetical protein
LEKVILIAQIPSVKPAAQMLPDDIFEFNAVMATS